MEIAIDVTEVKTEKKNKYIGCAVKREWAQTLKFSDLLFSQMRSYI